MCPLPSPIQRDRPLPRSSGAVPGGAAGTSLLNLDIRSHDRLVLATVDGELDVVTAPSLGDGLSPIVDTGNHLVLDLARVSFCSAAGLSLFVQLHHHAETAGGSLQLATPSAALRRVLGLTQLDNVLTTTPDVPSAITTLGVREPPPPLRTRPDGHPGIHQ